MSYHLGVRCSKIRGLPTIRKESSVYQTQSLREKFIVFFKIFLPILIYQFANFSAAFVDTTMTGQYDALHLAGVAMATSLWNPFFNFLTGIVSAMIPIIGHHIGAGRKDRVATDFYQFIYMALGLAVLLFALVFVGAPLVLGQLGLEPLVHDVALGYLRFLSLGIIPLLLFSVVRSLLDSLGLTRLSMYLMLLLLPLNGFFNYLLIYGIAGLPKLGGAGAGLGTSIAYWVLLFISLCLVKKHKKVRPYQLWKIQPFDKKALIDALKLGLPIGGTVFAEVSIFSGVGLVMAKYPSLIIASHQAAMNFSSLMYAFPLSISGAMAIIISYEFGAKRMADVKVYSRLGRLTALAFAGFTLAFLYFLRFDLAKLYGNNPEFVRMTATFMTYSLFFQMADVFAAPLQGILRGYKDTKVPFYLGVLSYWGVTFPLGFALESLTTLGPYSYWIGLIISLIVSGILYQWRLSKIVRRYSH